MFTLRPATEADAPAIDAVLRAAFPSAAEAELVAALCAAGDDALSLVAAGSDGQIVGHIFFSPIVIERNGQAIAREGLGLAPVAVLPPFQRQGIGSGLVQAGLAALRAAGCPYVVVLGDPDFYRRFGFVAASQFGLQNEYGVDEPFMVQELLAASLPPGGGLVRYAPAFATLGEAGEH